MKKALLFVVLIFVSLIAMPAFSATYSIDKLKLTQADLPEGYTLGKEMRSISIQPMVFYEKPDEQGMLPNPDKKDFQTLMFKGKHRGSLMLFQYKTKEDANTIKSALVALLWGDGNVPTQMHPEELYAAENVIMIFCFQYQSDEALLVKSFLSEKRGIDLFTKDERARSIIKTAYTYYNKEKAKKGVEYLEKNFESIKENSFGLYFLAEFYYMIHDWSNAGNYYEEALKIHKTKNKLPDSGILWASYHGLGISYAVSGKVKESIEPFKKSLDVAKSMNDKKCVATSSYDLSCSYAALRKYDDAFKLLKEAVQIDVKFKNMARDDSCFKDAMSQKRFLDLLK